MDLNWFEEIEARVPKGGVRTRFASFPMGYMHVGNLRTAFYTWLIARHSGGKLILRIEDTDQGRLIESVTEVIYTTLRKCGLTWDEDPDISGPVGPYIQTGRRVLYGKYAELLMEKSHAYYCFCKKIESEKDSSDFNRTIDPCRDAGLEEARVKVAAGVPHVIRQKIPVKGSAAFSDVVFGDITIESSTLDNQVLIRRDDLPTYNFANIIDDHLMGIVHVMWGSEYLSSAPKYNLPYRGFGWDVSTCIHCSPVMWDTHNKMSECKDDPSYENLIAMGHLSEAVVSYITLLGWSLRGEYAEREFFTLAELVEIFNISDIFKSPAIFDIEKLTYFNIYCLREMSPEAFHAVALPYIRQTVRNPALPMEEVTGLLRTWYERLTDIPEKLGFFDTLSGYNVGLFTNKKSKTNLKVSRRVLEATLPVLDGLADWTVDGIHDALIGLAKSLEVKSATLMWPMRIAAVSRAVTPSDMVKICHILGRDKCLCRLRSRLDELGG